MQRTANAAVKASNLLNWKSSTQVGQILLHGLVVLSAYEYRALSIALRSKPNDRCTSVVFVSDVVLHDTCIAVLLYWYACTLLQQYNSQ